MNDYELYRILENNGYETTNKNLTILKEGLASGEIVLNETTKSEKEEAEKKKKKAEFDANVKKSIDAAETRDEGGKAMAKRILKRAAGVAAGAVIGAGLAGSAGALTGNALDTKVADDATSAATKVGEDFTKADTTAKDAIAKSDATKKELDDVTNRLSDKSNYGAEPEASADASDKSIGVADIKSPGSPTRVDGLELRDTDSDRFNGKGDIKADLKTADSKFDADAYAKDSVKKSELESRYATEKKAADGAITDRNNKSRANDIANTKADVAKNDHHRRQWMTGVGTAAGAGIGGAVGYGVSKHLDKDYEKVGDAIHKRNKFIKKHSLDIDFKESIRDILTANGFEPSDDNVNIVMEGGALILSTEGIILTEGMAPDYALMKLLDANGFEPTAKNVRVLNAGLDSGSILLN